MASRDDILTAIRKNQPPERLLPELSDAWIEYPDARAQFRAVLEQIGGTLVAVRSVDEINAYLATLSAYQTARQIASLVPGVGVANVDVSVVEDPHELESIDFAILPGKLGVAENAAIWVTDEGLRHRALFFITQHLALVLPAASIVHNMHQAYDQISVGGRFFSGFIAGPSKTADIEQSLVIGAHGPRSLTVFLLDA